MLPPGASLNKNGSAVYKAATAVFIAHLYGVPVTVGMMATIVLDVGAVAASAGAGVPASSLITTLIVLNAIGLGPAPPRGLRSSPAVDRPLDMCRSTVNTIGNLVGTVAWLARSVGTDRGDGTTMTPQTDQREDSVGAIRTDPARRRHRRLRRRPA